MVIIGLLIDETMLTLSPLFCFAGSTGLSKVSSVKSCLNLVSLVKTLHKVFHWPAATECPDIWVRWTFGGYVSRNGSASRRTGGGHGASSTSAQKTISLTLTSPRQRSRKSWGCAFAIINKALTSFCFCKRTLLKDALFLTREGGARACDRVDQSHSSISSHIPELCRSWFSWWWFSYRQCTCS